LALSLIVVTFLRKEQAQNIVVGESIKVVGHRIKRYAAGKHGSKMRQITSRVYGNYEVKKKEKY